MTRKMLDEAWMKGLYQKTICTRYKGGEKTILIYNDLAIMIPLGACESGKMVLDRDGSIGLHETKYQKVVWEILAGKIEYHGNIYGVGAKLTFKDGDVAYANNVYEGETIIGFTKYLQIYCD